MNNLQHIKNCINFKSSGITQSIIRDTYSCSCKDCVYFSSRNCGMDAADNMTPEMGMFG